jgi:hypothetical protein
MDDKTQNERADLLHDLAEHLGAALYSDEWKTREYAIVCFNRYERMFPGSAKSDVDWFKNE